MRQCQIASALVLSAFAGLAVAQPLAITGQKKAEYGNPRWVNTIPTNAGDNATLSCDKNTIGGVNLATVLTGVELAIPLSALGNPTGTIKITAFINNQDGGFASNQWSGTSLVGAAGELAQPANFGETRAINIESDVRAAGKQYFTVNLAGAGTAPVIDGSRDASGWSARFQQGARTGFGDATQGTVDGAGGSELDRGYSRVAGGVLYLFFAGNLESNGNRLEIFFDVNDATGQNKLRGDNPLIGGTDGRLNRMGDDGTGNGLTFDSDFKASYWLGVNCGNVPFQFYVDYAKLTSADGTVPGIAQYCGSSGAASNGVLAGGEVGAPAILGTINNSNILGVPPFCPPPTGHADVSNGSELGALYSYVDKVNKRLYLFTSGNVKTDYSGALFFIDVGGFMTPGGEELGQNRIRNDNTNADFGYLNGHGGDGTGTNPGLTFDADFSPTYFLDYKNGGNVDNFSHAQMLRTNGRATVCGAVIDYGTFDGGNKANPNPQGQIYDVIKYNGLQGYPGGVTEPFIGIQEQDGTRTDLEGNFPPYASHKFMAEYVGEPCNSIPGNPAAAKPAGGIILMRMDQSNLGGQTAVGGAAFTEEDVLAVNSGLEWSIDLAELGYDGVSDIKIAGFIETVGGFTITNQVFGELPASYGDLPTGSNVGVASAVNFDTIPGKQWVLAYETCPADFNNDTFVDDSDFVLFASAYNDLIAPSRWALGDVNGDGLVDDSDFVTFAGAYNDLLCPNIME
jgi:hypothetical protein